MEIAIKISDDLLRDSAVCQIVVLCLKANDLRTALILFRAVQAVSIRNDMLTIIRRFVRQSLNHCACVDSQDAP
jgi:hypothetical protein